MSWMENLNWFDQVQILHITDFYQVSDSQLAEVIFARRGSEGPEPLPHVEAILALTQIFALRQLPAIGNRQFCRT